MLGRLNLSSLQPHSYFQLLPTASECLHVFQINIPKQVFAPTKPLLYYMYCLISVKSITILSKCQRNPEFPSHFSIQPSRLRESALELNRASYHMDEPHKHNGGRKATCRKINTGLNRAEQCMSCLEDCL